MWFRSDDDKAAPKQRRATALRDVESARALEAAGDYDAADRKYAHALELCPQEPDVLSAYAQFFQHVQGNHDRAEALYKLSLRSNPTHLDTLQYYAIFLEEVRGDLDAAERLYSIALESTRDGLLDDIATPNTAELQHMAPGAGPRYLAERDPPHGEHADEHEPASKGGHGGSVDGKEPRSRNKIPSRDLRDPPRLRQSPKREQLREKLNRIPPRKSPGSSRGQVDAERRFTDGSYSISDDKTAGTRHLKGYKGSIHAVPWMGPLDRPKSARKKAPSTGKTDRLENALPIGAEVGHGEASSASSSNAIGQGARQHVERYLQDGDGAPALNAEGRRRDGVALQDSSGSWALERFRSSAGYSEPSVVSAHPSSSLSVTSSSVVHEVSGDGALESRAVDPGSLRYDPQLRLKTREVFNSVEQLQQAGVIISHTHICSMLKNALNLNLARDIGVRFVKHFLSRPGCARLSSTHAEDKRARYDAFARDVFTELEKGQQTSRSAGHAPLSRHDLDADLGNLPDTMYPEEVNVVSSKKVAAKVSLKNWLQESRALGLSALSSQQNSTLATSNGPSMNAAHAHQGGHISLVDETPDQNVAGSTHKMLARLVSHPGRQYESKLDDLPPSLHSTPDDDLSLASADMPSRTGDSHVTSGLEYSEDTLVLGVKSRPRPVVPENLGQFSRSSSADSRKAATRHTPADRPASSQMKEFDVDDCFDADSVYHPARQSTRWSEGGRAVTSSAQSESVIASRNGATDLTRRPSNAVSTAVCKFELLRPQEAISGGQNVSVDYAQGSKQTDEQMAGCDADYAQPLSSEQRVSVDVLLSAVQRSLSAQGQGDGSNEDEDFSGEQLNEFEEMNRFFAAERAKILSNDTMSDKSTDTGQRMDVLTRAAPSTSVSARSFQCKPAASAPALPRAHLQKLNEEIFAALRQKCHTATMIFGYLSSRAVDEHNTSRARNSEFGAGASKRNSVSKPDFKTAILQMGLGLSEDEIGAVYDLNADVWTGELTFNQLQRAIKGINQPTTPRAVSASKRDNKEPKESDKIREVLKKVWSSAEEAFVFFDISGSDTLNMTQLRQGLKRLRLNAIRLEVAFQEIDLDRDGRISERDFIRHFAAGWHPLGDFIQMRKAYENVKAKHRHRVANDFQAYIDALNREDAAKSPLRAKARSPPPWSSGFERPTHLHADVSRTQKRLDEHGDVEIELVLDMDFDEAMEHEAEVRRGIQRDIAFSCDGEFDKVKVLKLRAGSVIADIVLCQGLCADGRSPQDAANDLQKQMHDQQSSLLLCEYTGCVLDIIVKHPDSARDNDIMTPEPVDGSGVAEGGPPCSPVIEGLDLHGFDSATHRRSNEPPRYAATEDEIFGRRKLLDPPPIVSAHDRRPASADVDFAGSRGRGDWNHDSDPLGLTTNEDVLLRATSNDTSIADSDSRSQQDLSPGDDTYDDVFADFHRRPNFSGPRHIRATNSSARGDREDETIRPASRSAVERFSTAEHADDGAMTPSKLAALRLQIKRLKENEMRRKEEETIREHKRMLLDKRRNRRLQQEAARLERSRSHQNNTSASSEGGLRLFSRYRASEPAPKRIRAHPGFSPPSSPVPQERDVNEKRPGGATPGRSRSVRWNAPQVRTYETEHDSEGSGTAESEKDIDHDSSSSSSD